MAKCIYICTRERLPPFTGRKLHDICESLSPDNITPPKPRVAVIKDIGYAVMNPTSTHSESGTYLLMEQLFDKNENWSKPLQEFPDGSYALFRNGEEYSYLNS